MLSCQASVYEEAWFSLVSRTGDPLGKVIALITLTIFLLSLLTFCLRVFANSCGDRRCCVVQCAISLQCCCEWKAGRLRILPNSPGHTTHPRESGIDQQYRTNGRRASLYPPPPPTYVELFPEGNSGKDASPSWSFISQVILFARSRYHLKKKAWIEIFSS